jgi:hypothetical protein
MLTVAACLNCAVKVILKCYKTCLLNGILKKERYKKVVGKRQECHKECFRSLKHTIERVAH